METFLDIILGLVIQGLLLTVAWYLGWKLGWKDRGKFL